MPIRFRCPTCGGLLSTARRKVGSQVECPRCRVGVTVPSEDTVPPAAAAEDETPGAWYQENGTRSAPAEPARQPAKAAAGERPLFETIDLDEMMEPMPERPVKTADTGSGRSSSGYSSPAPHHDGDDGVYVSRGAIVILAILMIVLIALAFATGFMLGS
ncbi:hypothetical protein [Fimbriiglobus ruber]|uniref:Uncharacterized protein n=1 Tax=Fimbriiglobus ruber TaxID=1908690 RepID=A0A225DGI0_9BACT|nr:hypothetical protein [Fimbriiglobus ruber]OWK36279.1 hypothetical protein FRUB_08842 [Fimbriiglobus ruber]